LRLIFQSGMPETTRKRDFPGGKEQDGRPQVMTDPKDDHDRVFSENYARAAARVLEAVSRTAQLSSLATPEVQDLFENWLEILGRQILLDQEVPGRMDIPSKAAEIGVSSSSLLGLLLYLQRQGRICITEVLLAPGCGRDEDICDCIRQG